MFQQISLSGNHIHKHIPAIIGIIQHNKQINNKPPWIYNSDIFKRYNKIHKLVLNISLNKSLI